ncbi:hypothetical protein LHP98_05165 [Rhodobacter sp. Har01]|uniref:hypothetical protein n=1 Tax=Rhodobacter sp. Har01 TaxID=2883999 RepID=UPI001D073617|nr:hypothetical protein [Rhodobacter sp. Har01]MCB6177519.1 hypothetical protein [Rhodobacter sp. Har01]
MRALAIVPTREVVPHRPEVVASRRRDDFESLWLTVIMSAVEDLFSPSSAATAQDQSDALHFLTDKVGAWAASRRDVATAAGIDHEHLREHVVSILEGAEPPDGMLSGDRGRKPANFVSGVVEARRQWAQRLAKDQETLDRSRAFAAEASERRAKEREAERVRAERDAAFGNEHAAAIARRQEHQDRLAATQAAQVKQEKLAVGRAQGKEFFALEPLEIGGLNFGRVATFKRPWAFGDFCTVLDAYLPNPNAAAGRMLREVTQPEAVLCDHYADQSTRWESLRKIEAITGLTPLYFDKDGGPELKAFKGRTMRLRLRP